MSALQRSRRQTNDAQKENALRAEAQIRAAQAHEPEQIRLTVSMR